MEAQLFEEQLLCKTPVERRIEHVLGRTTSAVTYTALIMVEKFRTELHARHD